MKQKHKDINPYKLSNGNLITGWSAFFDKKFWWNLDIFGMRWDQDQTWESQQKSYNHQKTRNYDCIMKWKFISKLIIRGTVLEHGHWQNFWESNTWQNITFRK